jgi:hypothetical protein
MFAGMQRNAEVPVTHPPFCLTGGSGGGDDDEGGRSQVSIIYAA